MRLQLKSVDKQCIVITGASIGIGIGLVPARLAASSVIDVRLPRRPAAPNPIRLSSRKRKFTGRRGDGHHGCGRRCRHEKAPHEP